MKNKGENKMERRGVKDIKEKLRRVTAAMPETTDTVDMNAVFAERAQRLAQRKKVASKHLAGERTIPIMVFFLGKEKYGLELELLREIIPFQQCTPVPKAPPAITGVINLRGEIRCVVDLATLLSLPRETTPTPGYILIVKKNETGFKIDAPDKVISLKESEIDSKTIEKNPVSNPWVKNITAGNIILLDVEKILSHPLFQVQNHKEELP